MQASAIQSSVKRQVLKTILFALPKAMNLTASRVPAFRERLKQRDLVAWIGLQDGSIGRGNKGRQVLRAFRRSVRSAGGHVVQRRADRLASAHAQSQAERHHPQRQELQDGDNRAGRPRRLVAQMSGSRFLGEILLPKQPTSADGAPFMNENKAKR